MMGRFLPNIWDWSSTLSIVSDMEKKNKKQQKNPTHLTTVLQAIYMLFVTISSRALQLEINDNSSSFSPSYPYSSLVAVNTGDGQPGGQIQHVLQHLLIQLQVGQLTLSLQCAQVDLIWGEVLSEPTQRQKQALIG